MCECCCWLNTAGWVQMKEGNKNATVSMQCIINHREQLTKHHLSTSGLIPQPQSYVNDRLESFMTAFFNIMTLFVFIPVYLFFNL